jgi:alkanesulfonate monooxygenase SsuD/methylene tetrahydromethanopterin reductase-like flavin-dependent oxidoreductase (luciferase family)
VDISLCLDAGRPWSELHDLARRADQSEVYVIYVPDHFGMYREAWTLMSALAACTERVRLGTLVLGVTHRHVPVLAEMARTLDEVSGGRLLLGLGAAWNESEHRSLGLTFPMNGDRLDLLESACRRLTDSGPPLLVGGAGERRTMPIAARYASVWHAWAEPETFQRKGALMDQFCHDAGRDPSEVRRVTGAMLIGESDPAAILAAYRQAGADEFVVRDHHQVSVAESFAAVLQARWLGTRS